MKNTAEMNYIEFALERDDVKSYEDLRKALGVSLSKVWRACNRDLTENEKEDLKKKLEEKKVDIEDFSNSCEVLKMLFLSRRKQTKHARKFDIKNQMIRNIMEKYPEETMELIERRSNDEQEFQIFLSMYEKFRKEFSKYKPKQKKEVIMIIFDETKTYSIDEFVLFVNDTKIIHGEESLLKILGKNSLRTLKFNLKKSFPTYNVSAKVSIENLGKVKDSKVAEEPKVEEETKPTKVAEEPKVEEETKPTKVAEEPKVEEETKPTKVAEELKVEEETKPTKVAEEPKVEEETKPTKVAEEPKVEEVTKSAKVAEKPKVKEENKPTKVAEEPKVEEVTKSAKVAEELKVEEETKPVMSAYQKSFGNRKFKILNDGVYEWSSNIESAKDGTMVAVDTNLLVSAKFRNNIINRFRKIGISSMVMKELRNLADRKDEARVGINTVANNILNNKGITKFFPIPDMRVLGKIYPDLDRDIEIIQSIIEGKDSITFVTADAGAAVYAWSVGCPCRFLKTDLKNTMQKDISCMSDGTAFLDNVCIRNVLQRLDKFWRIVISSEYAKMLNQKKSSFEDIKNLQIAIATDTRRFIPEKLNSDSKYNRMAYEAEVISLCLEKDYTLVSNNKDFLAYAWSFGVKVALI